MNEYRVIVFYNHEGGMLADEELAQLINLAKGYARIQNERERQNPQGDLSVFFLNNRKAKSFLKECKGLDFIADAAITEALS